MELGQRIKQARLDAGLSQRQLCGDMITRNMLSLIENGSARPSVDTLQYLAARLEKPVGYFLEEETVSVNQSLITQAREVSSLQALTLLKAYQKPDPLFDPEYYLLTALSCMALARQAIEENRLPLAAQLLEQAAQAGAATIYYTPELEQRRLLLCHQANTASASTLAAKLPDNSPELILRACAALEAGDPAYCAACLDAAQTRDETWYFLRGEAFLAQKQYANAADCYKSAQALDPQKVYARLELCYKELEDFQQAYFYACKQRM